MQPESPAIGRPRGKIPVFDLLEKSLAELKAKCGIKRMGIFGSCARGEESPSSDVDVLVEFVPGRATCDNFMNLAEERENLFKRRVDLLSVAGIDKYIRSKVEREVIGVEG